jgi:hypothetical protein
MEPKMHYHTATLRLSLAALVALNLVAASVFAQEAKVENAAAAAPVVNPNDALFVKLRVQCEAVGCNPPGNGDVCVDAVAILMLEEPASPEFFRDMNKTGKKLLIMRLLEKGVPTSNRARAMAYDMYMESAALGSFVNPVSDPYRASELGEMMAASGFVGGKLRQIRDSIKVFGSRESNAVFCKQGRAILAKGGLDETSLRIANEIDSSSACDKQNPGMGDTK